MFEEWNLETREMVGYNNQHSPSLVIGESHLQFDKRNVEKMGCNIYV